MVDLSNNYIRKTQSTCSECYRKIDACLIEQEGKIIMEKYCPEHGKGRLTVSKHPWYYKQLTEYYFRVMPKSMEQKRFYIYLSNNCNLNCPICLLQPNQSKTPDMSLAAFKEVIKKNRNSRFYLYGAEPTLRGDLEQWVRLLKRYGNAVNIHTNGIKLADYNYLCRLESWGVDYISMQFDGFDDHVYLRLRGQQLLDLKLKALENLKKLNMATGLNVTIGKGINENQMQPILDYAIKNTFIKDVSFATLSFLGNADTNFSRHTFLMPDELIDIIEDQTRGKITRKNMFLFQKLYYTLLSAFGVRRCYNFQHLVVYRDKNAGYITLDELFDLESFQRHFYRYGQLAAKKRMLAITYFLANFLISFFGKNFLKKVRCVPFSMFLPGKIRNVKIPLKTLFVSFGTVCDYYKYDSELNSYCGQGFCFADKDKTRMTDSVPELALFHEKKGYE